MEAVERGVDMFDCIIPTKMAQQGYAYTFQGLLPDRRGWPTGWRTCPLDPTCDCFACRRRQPWLPSAPDAREARAAGAGLLSIHNLRHYQVLMGRMREAILGRDVRRAGAGEMPRCGHERLRAVVLRSGEASIRERRAGEIMHPGLGPRREPSCSTWSRPGLAERLAPTEPGSGAGSLDVGLGAATNALAVLALRAAGATGRPLDADQPGARRGPLRLALSDPRRSPGRRSTGHRWSAPARAVGSGLGGLRWRWPRG